MKKGTFRDKLLFLMDEKELTQTEVSSITGIGRPSISQYCSGKIEPSRQRKRQMAVALGMDKYYFDDFAPVEKPERKTDINMPVSLAAKLLGKSHDFVAIGLQQGVFPWGYAVKLGRWSYFISPTKFTEYTGIEVPINA